MKGGDHIDKLVTVNWTDPIYSKIRRKRTGRLVYRDRFFVVVEFTGATGRFREAFWPEQIVR